MLVHPHLVDYVVILLVSITWPGSYNLPRNVIMSPFHRYPQRRKRRPQEEKSIQEQKLLGLAKRNWILPGESGIGSWNGEMLISKGPLCSKRKLLIPPAWILFSDANFLHSHLENSSSYFFSFHIPNIWASFGSWFQMIFTCPSLASTLDELSLDNNIQISQFEGELNGIICAEVFCQWQSAFKCRMCMWDSQV